MINFSLPLISARSQIAAPNIAVDDPTTDAIDTGQELPQLDPEEVFKDIVSMVPLEERHKVADYYAAQADIKKDALLKGTDARTQMIETLQASRTPLNKKKQEVLETIVNDKQLSKSETAAMLLVGMLPILAGGLIKGKRGIAKGADAASVGVQLMQKGFESDVKRNQDAAKIQLKSIESELAQSNKDEMALTRDQLKATETANENALDRANRLESAGMRSGRSPEEKQMDLDYKANRAKKQAVDLSDAEIEEEARKHSYKIDIGTASPNGTVAMIPSKKVTKEAAAKVNDKSVPYERIINNLNRVDSLAKGADWDVFARTWGDTSTEIGQLMSSVKADLAAIRTAKGGVTEPGLKALEGALTDPTSFIAHVSSIIGKNGTVQGGIDNMRKTIADDFQSFLQTKGFTPVKLGQYKLVEDMLPDGRPVLISQMLKDVGADGSQIWVDIPAKKVKGPDGKIMRYYKTPDGDVLLVPVNE